MSVAAMQMTRTDSVAFRLRSEILDGVMAPGSLLAEAAVAKRLGVSRVPVREALFRLENEGIVESSVTGRTFVRHLTPNDFDELFEMRLALEPLAARRAAIVFRDNVSSLEENVSDTAKARSVAEVTSLDLDFHDSILVASGNTRLISSWRSLRSQLELWLGQLHRQHQLRTQETRQETVEAHSGIIESFKTQSPAACERLLRDHIFGWRRWLPAFHQADPS
jgi:DNA-binding GntR family transcriptional regulator